MCLRLGLGFDPIVATAFIALYVFMYTSGLVWRVKKSVKENESVVLSDLRVRRFLLISGCVLCDSVAVFVGVLLYSDGSQLNDLRLIMFIIFMIVTFWRLLLQMLLDMMLNR